MCANSLAARCVLLWACTDRCLCFVLDEYVAERSFEFAMVVTPICSPEWNEVKVTTEPEPLNIDFAKSFTVSGYLIDRSLQD